MSTPRERQFETMYRATRADVLAYLVRRSPQPADAADVLADVYLTAWRRLDDVPPEPGTRLWLFGVARRSLANHHRSGRRRERLAEGLASALSHAPAGPADAEVVDRDRLRAVVDAVNRLPARDREVLMLHAWERLSSAEVAAVIGSTPGAVRARVHRARERVRAAVAGEEPARRRVTSLDGRRAPGPS